MAVLAEATHRRAMRKVWFVRSLIPALFAISLTLDLGSPDVVQAQDASQETKAEKPSSEGLTLKPTRKLEYTVNEGTWISLDVSPDGETIVFELVGHLYTMPIGGGTAKAITSGLPFDSQPRFSPDGKHIVFISDRSGADNVWISKADGSDPKALTSEVSTMFVSPSWSRDGRYILVSRAKPRAYGEALELWMYDINGGSGVAVTQTKKDESGIGRGAEALGAVLSPDGHYVYYATKASESESAEWQIARRDLGNGEEETLTFDQGGGFRPLLSPDGTKLVYATRYDSGTALRLRDLVTSTDRWLKYPIQRDSQDSGETTRDLLPGYAFTPDGKSVVLTLSGKIHSLTLDSGEDRTIPFDAAVSRELGPKLNFQSRVEEGPIEARLIQGAVESPNGNRVAFSALGHLYVASRKAAHAQPQRATSTSDNEFDPAWSPDGKWLAYVTWSASEGGSVWKIAGDRSGSPAKLTNVLAYYQQPTWSPDGARVIVLRAPRSVALEQNNQWLHPVDGLELVSVPSGGGPSELVAPAAHYTFPHFAGPDGRLFVTELQKPNLQNVSYSLVSMRADGSERHTIIKLTHKAIWGSDFSPPAKITVSPDGTRAVALFRSQAYLFDLPIVGGAPPTIDLNSPAVAVERLTDLGADFVGWGDDGKTIVWSLGSSYFRLPVSDAEAGPAKEEGAGQGKAVASNSPQAAGLLHPEVQRFVVQVPRDTPHGTVALRGATIITMKGDEALKNADIVIRDNRIESVGAKGSVKIPADAKVVDVTGNTIVPGFIDIHAHWDNVRRDVLDLENWNFLATLAYGITAGRDPQTYTNDTFAYQDLADAGEIIGPRAFSTGPGLFNVTDFQSEDEAEKVIRRYKEYYRTNLIKSYLVGDRRQRQFVVEACDRLHVIPTTEGAADMPLDLTHVIDGYGGNEHQFPVSPLYSDVVQLVAKSGIYYTPTFILGYYDGPGSEDYYLETTDVYNNPKIRHFVPHGVLETRTSGLQWFRKDQYEYPVGAASAWAILKDGGKVGVGGHGELQGLSFHWQLWSLQSGGMSNLEALRAGTLYGAEAIGLAQDLGSLEPGKLADLVVLSKDPLADIQNTTSVRYVMKNGRLFEGDTLNEVWPRRKTAGPYWWWKDHP
jgi:Tol biopolymer transport system component